MAAQLKNTVYVRDPDTHQTVVLEQGTSPEPRLAALVTSQAAWVDGKLPRLRTQTKPEGEGAREGSGPSGDGPDGASSDGSGPSADGDPDAEAPPVEESKPPARTAKKTAARKTAQNAAEGTGGQ